jgi:cytoskeleton protein RodZ
MTDESLAAAGPSAGQLLRRAREAAGMHVAALAVALKVPVRKLEALEEDRYDLLPDAVFVRALASSVCRTLKIDPQPILERLPQTSAPRLVQDRDGINAPFRAPGEARAPTWRDQLGKPMALVVVALLLGAVAIIFVPQLKQEEVPPAVLSSEPVPGAPVVYTAPAEPRAGNGDASTAVAATGPVITTAITAASPTTAAATPTLSVPQVQSPTAIVTPSPAVAAAVTAASAAATAAAATPAAAASAVAAGSTVVFRTTGESWIHVTDARGTTVLRRLMGAGESAGAAGALPLSVTVGSASATQVQVRGKPFDLAPVIGRDNVARFEVK